MSAFFSFLFVISIIATLVTLIIALVSFLRKKPHRKYLKIAGISAVIGTASLVGAMATQTPEERAAQQQRAAERQEEKDRLAAEKQAQKEKEEAEKQARKAQEAAESDAKKAQEAREKEKAAADATAQKLYDDQAEYEDWIKTSAIIGNKPGLGDRVDEFAKNHKLSSDVGMIKAFDDDHFNVTVIDGRIVSLQITATKGHKMDSVIPSLIPADGTEVSSSVDNSDPLVSHHISEGHSDILDIAIPSSNGYYTRIDTYDAPSGNYLHTTLAVKQ
jgi:hypothetical protein